MSEETLVRFCEVNIVDVKGDDTKLEKLRAAAKALSGVVKKSPAKTQLFTMVAADPTVAPDDPSIDEAMAVLKEHWMTYNNVFSGKPLVVLRALLLDAVVQAARGSDVVAVAFVNSARNALPYVESSDESPIWLDAVKEIELLVDARAEAEWTTPEMIPVPELDVQLPAIKVGESPTAEIDGSSLLTKVTNAVNNGNHPNSNFQAWNQQLATRLSSAIEEEVDSAFARLKTTPVDLSPPLKALASTMATHIQKTLESFSVATAGLERRTNLLWWKEALYSRSTQSSYRKFPAFQGAALMALDLHEQVPLFSPASVAAFLEEAIRLLPVEAPAEKDAFTLVTDARSDAALVPLRKAAAKLAPMPQGRGPVLSLIGHSSESSGLDGAKLRALAGITPTAMLTPAKWGTLLFRELQASRATLSVAAKRTRSRD